MTKTELVKEIAKANKITNTRAQMELDSILEIIMDAVCGGDEVNIKGFGKFYPKQYRAKSCINPKTGEKMDIPAHICCNFTCGKNFKARISRKVSKESPTSIGGGRNCVPSIDKSPNMK